MPPPKGTKPAKNAPNQHDKRHENGLAPPGKRVTKQRSNGQLNGHANGKALSSVPPPQLPSTGLNQGLKFPRPTDTAADPAFSAVARDPAATLERVERDRTSSDASLEENGSYGEMAEAMQDHSVHTTMDGPAVVYKPNPGHAGHTLSAVSTILSYYPLRDAISILILLLSLPPTLVLVIQTLFASLTFVPPTTGLSLSAIPNIRDVFSANTPAAPALWTALTVDVIIGIAWMLVWKPVQNIFLDLSQAAIAVSLSGAAAGASGPAYSIATCTLIVCVVHVLRYKAIHLTALDYLRSVLHKADAGSQLDASSYFSSFYFAPPTDRGWLFSLIHTILGIHIVSQGVTTCVRYSLVKNKKDQSLSALPRSDPEAVATSDTPPRTLSAYTDGSPQLNTGPISTPPPGLRDGKSRESSSKKKRKQANQARMQQPLWAAVASTKVTFVKEVEQREAANDAREVSAMEGNTGIGLSPNAQVTNRIWICDVGDTEVSFRVDLPASASNDNIPANEGNNPLAASIDKSKPFYVRVNGATWASTRIRSTDSENDTGRSSEQYLGEVFGLAPLSSYHCEVISTTDYTVLCSASLITQPPPTAEQAALVSAPTHPQSLRPSSPITTLKQSILSAEARLNEVRNRSKKSKKDQRAVHSDIKKEIHQFKNKLESSGGQDDKQKSRLNQLSQHKNQAEEAATDMRAQIEALGEIPADELAESEAKKRTWEAALDARDTAKARFDLAKAEQDGALNAIKSEIANAENKKEKLLARIAQRAQELERLTAKQEADLTAKQKRDVERTHVLQDRERQENELRFHIAQMETEAQSLTQKGQEAWQQLSALSGWSAQAPANYHSYSTPPTPEAAISAASNGSVVAPVNAFPAVAFGPQSYPAQFDAVHNASFPNGNGAPRGRSSSMLSQYSGFTDNGEDFVMPIASPSTWPTQSSANIGALLQDRKTSDGDGSGYGGSLTNGSTNGSNSPRPEARPFVPAGSAGTPVKAVGPIGPPSKHPPPSPTAAHAGMMANGR